MERYIETVNGWDNTVTQEPVEVEEYTWSDFEPDESDDIEGKFILTVWDPDGEEFATIVHRESSMYPIDGNVADQKRANAQRIVDLLNAADKQ